MPRYKWQRGNMPEFDLERRDFLKFFSGGLVLLLTLDGISSAQEPGRATAQRPDARPPELAAWLHISEDGAITVYTGKVEMGQNIRTSLAQAVAEELRMPITALQLVMADTDLTPYDMGTFGNRTIPLMAPQLRKVGAAAREALIDLAADKWKLDRASITLTGGKVKNNVSGESVGFGELTRGQKLVKTVDGAKVTPTAEWTLQGTSVLKVNARDMALFQMFWWFAMAILWAPWRRTRPCCARPSARRRPCGPPRLRLQMRLSLQMLLSLRIRTCSAL
jgi:nicotinate dehydrogenase subunit B